jgi:hypothetical protein
MYELVQYSTNQQQDPSAPAPAAIRASSRQPAPATGRGRAALAAACAPLLPLLRQRAAMLGILVLPFLLLSCCGVGSRGVSYAAAAAAGSGDGEEELLAVTFDEEGPLGLKFSPNKGGEVEVLKINAGTQGERLQTTTHLFLRAGLVLRSVGGTSVGGMAYLDVIELIKSNTARPLELKFSGHKESAPAGDEAGMCGKGEAKDQHGKCAAKPPAATAMGTDANTEEKGAGEPDIQGLIRGVGELPVPNVTNHEYVVDFAGVLAPEDLETLQSSLKVATRNTTMQPMVLTVHQIPQPEEGKTLHRVQLLRTFGSQLCRHWFPSQPTTQAKVVVYIVQTGLSPPRLEVYVGRRSKTKLKDQRVRGILRHPNVTKSMSAEPPRYAIALHTAIQRSVSILKQSEGLLGGGGFRGVIPLVMGGCFFLYFNSQKKRGGGGGGGGGMFGGSGGGGRGLDPSMEREFEQYMHTLNPSDASQLKAAMGRGSSSTRMGGQRSSRGGGMTMRGRDPRTRSFGHGSGSSFGSDRGMYQKSRFGARSADMDDY